MRTYSRRERVLFGIIAPIPVIAIAVMIVERATYANWFWLALFVGALVTALSLKIVLTGSAWTLVERKAGDGDSHARDRS
jgi:hypothetical protein